MDYKTNKYQTALTPELLDSLPKEVKGDLLEAIESIKFVQWLVSPEEVRGYAKDKKRWDQPNLLDERKEDPSGRIYVDITKPHILENIDFFRERAIFFEKNGKYTNIPPNPNPKSSYAEFWRNEVNRWANGLVRESDGEWITGYHYFYLNYVYMWINEEDNPNNANKRKKVKGVRRREFPGFWQGDYLWFHYMEQARDNAAHCKLLKRRGCGFSWKFGGITPCTMYVQEGLPNYHLASDKGFLTGDRGVFGKVIDVLDWIATNTPLPKLRLVDQPLEKTLGYKDPTDGTRKGILSSVSGISLKDNPDKARGLRGPIIQYEEDGVFDNLEDAWNVNLEAVEEGGIVFGTMISGGCVCAGTKVWTKDFRNINIEDLKKEDGIIGFDLAKECIVQEDIIRMNPPSQKECVKIHTNYRTIECSIDHPILVRNKYFKNTDDIVGIRRDYYAKLDKWYETPKYKTITVYEKGWKDADRIIVGDIILTVNKIDVWGKETLFDARLVGMLIGDGSYGLRRHYNKIEYKTPSFSNCDNELVQYVLNNYSCNIEVQRPTKNGRLYHEISIKNLVKSLKDIGIGGQSKDGKRLPTNYKDLTKKDAALLLAGLYDTDGFISYRKGNSHKVSITQSSREILEQIKELLEKFGIVGTIKKCEPRIAPNRKDKNPWYTLDCGSKESIKNFYENIPLLIKYKKENLRKIVEEQQSYIHRTYNTFNNIREERVIKIEKIGKKNIYNLTTSTTHTYLANNIITHNTGGTEGANFEGSEKLFYYPEAYNIYGIPNVFDKNANGESKCGFFWGAYLNRARYTDKSTGESDVIGALIEVLTTRYNIKNFSRDAKALTQKKAEQPITPQDAVMRMEGSIFPVSDLKDYLAEIMPNISRFTAPHYVGYFTIGSEGEVKFEIDNNLTPIRDYPALDNKVGAVEIFEMPRGKDPFRFILGCLPTGEKVMTDKGLKEVQEITLNDKLFNENGGLVDINNLQKYNVINEDTYTLRVANTFRKTTFTKEHPILVSKPLRGYWGTKKCKEEGVSERYFRFKFEYKRAEEICKGDWLKVPNIYRDTNKFDIETLWENSGYRVDRLLKNPIYNEDFWWFIGLWLGDGWCESNGYAISMAFNKAEQFYIEKYERIVKSLFNRKISKRIRGNGVECKFCSQQLSRFLTTNFGKYAGGKYIPEWAKKIDTSLKANLVLGYLDSDGCIKKDYRGLYTCEFVSINLTLLEGFQDIIFSLGIVSSTSLLRKASVHILNGKKCNTKETYHLRISHHDLLKLVPILNCYEDIKIKRINFSNLPKVRRNPQYKCFIDDSLEYIYFQIVDVEKNMYTGNVYNFECATHTFMCHHITTHNCDVFDDDSVGYSDSLGSILVFDRWTRRIVAEYTGRPQTANEFYEIVYRMARFYNATIMYENNKKGLFAYFANVKKAVTMLADTPQIITDKQVLKPKNVFDNTSKGINATAAINVYGRRLQADWMVENAYTDEVKYDDDGEEIVVRVPNLKKIRSIGYIKEAIAWNSEINCDRISAGNMVFIYDAELTEYGSKQFKEKITGLKDDPFFNRTKFRKKNQIVMKGWNY